jgi:putative NADH-flavin reductase
MNIAVFGATGGTGRETTKQALAQGHAVTVLARTPSKLDISNDNLTIVQGDVLDQATVDQVVAGQDVVVVSLGNTPNNPDMVVSQGTKRIIDAMKRHGVKRIIAVTSLGAGDSKENVPFAFKMIMKTVLRKAFQDKDEQERLIQESGLDWFIVRPGGLTDSAATGKYRVGIGADITAGQVARADVAGFVATLFEGDQYLRQPVGIT